MTNLKHTAVIGVRWTSLNTACATILQLTQLAILGRILGPKAYGLMAMVTVVIGFVQVFADVGLSSAIIQRKNPIKEELSTLYWINVFAGLIMYTAIYLATPLVAKGFNAKEINSLLPIASLAFLISPFGVQFRTLLQKNLRFDVITKINVSSTLCAMLVAIACACNGYGVWSLVWGSLSNTILRTALLVVWARGEKWLPALHFKWSDTHGYLSFGLYRVGAMSANYFNSRVDQLLIGALMGPVALGYYNIAFRLVLEPIQKLTPILTSVAFPVFSIIQDETDRLKNAFLKMVRFLMGINAPVLIGLAAVAPLAIPLLVGNKWMPSVPLVRVLAFYALVRSLAAATGSLVISKGKANWTLYSNLALTVVIPPVIYLASLSGQVVHIAFALACTYWILLFCFYRIFIRSLIGPCFSEYIRAFGRPILLAMVMGGCVLITSFFTPALPRAANLFVQVAIGAISYIALTWLFQRSFLLEAAELLPFRFRRRDLGSHRWKNDSTTTFRQDKQE